MTGKKMVVIDSCIGKGQMLAMPYYPPIDEWLEFRRDQTKLEAFARQCLLIKNIATDPEVK